MKIVLFSNQSFLVNELKKTTVYEEINYTDDISDLYDLLSDNATLLYHLDCDADYKTNINTLLNEFINLKVIALRNNTNNIEGCEVLKKGYKAYAHSLSPLVQLEDIIKAVNNGNIWMYPELMQFLISTVPLNEKTQNDFLEKISVKELEVLELVAQGLNNADIAKTLDLAEVTVKKHISSLFKKLEQKDRLSLALYYKNNS